MRRLLVLSGLVLVLAASQGLAQQTPAAQKVPETATKPAPEEQPPAAADDTAAPDQPAPIDFEGGKFTITQTEEYGEKTLSYDGKAVASNYYVSLDKIAEVGGVKVALFDVGDGGNACGPATYLAWKPEGGDLRTQVIGENDCGAPPAAISDSSIYFVPYLLPGDSKAAMQWSPDGGLTTAGIISFTPEPGTGWSDIDASKYQSIVDAFHNESVYKAAQKLLGDRLTDVVTSLLVGGGTEATASGAFYSSGCVPHACGVSDGFMAVDAAKRKLYFAQQREGQSPESWPPEKTWPTDLRAAMTAALAPPQ